MPLPDQQRLVQKKMDKTKDSMASSEYIKIINPGLLYVTTTVINLSAASPWQMCILHLKQSNYINRP